MAVRVARHHSAFYDCRFLGYQDTVLDDSGRHYFRNCYIEGAVDFVAGNGKSIYQVTCKVKSWFTLQLWLIFLFQKLEWMKNTIYWVCWTLQNCVLHAIPIKSGAFVAQKRSSPSEDTGFVFLQCKLTGKGLMHLGRAWGSHSTVVFVNSYMDGIIIPEGWTDWNDPTRQK